MTMDNTARCDEHSSEIVSIKGRDFVLCDGKEVVLGFGERQFLLSLDTENSAVYLTDPRSGEKMKLPIRNSNGERVTEKLQKIISIGSHRTERVTKVEEFPFDIESFRGTVIHEVRGLKPGSSIFRMDLVIENAFRTNPDVQHNIAILGENNEVLMPETWSDPNVEGSYSTSLTYTVGPLGILRLRHDLANMISGSGVLKVHTARDE